jgi:hypothetical protein
MTNPIQTENRKCKTLEHDFKHLKQYGWADWRCPKCGENVMLLLVFAYDAGIDLTNEYT